jgi:hypothetical protein
LRAHGLPPVIFGFDKPTIDRPLIEAKAIEGNGLDSDEPIDIELDDDVLGS